MTKFSGQQRWAISDSGRPYLELPEGRDELPTPGETEWDRLAKSHQRRLRAQFEQEKVDSGLIRPVRSPPR